MCCSMGASLISVIYNSKKMTDNYRLPPATPLCVPYFAPSLFSASPAHRSRLLLHSDFNYNVYFINTTCFSASLNLPASPLNEMSRLPTRLDTEAITSRKAEPFLKFYYSRYCSEQNTSTYKSRYNAE